MSVSTPQDMEEIRLIAVYRAIKKMGHPEIIDSSDASLIAAYINGLVDMDKLELNGSAENLEWYLDGIILGLSINKLLTASVPIEDLPRPQSERDRQFQTGVDPVTNEVHINK
jgi:hypothetical protein